MYNCTKVNTIERRSMVWRGGKNTKMAVSVSQTKCSDFYSVESFIERVVTLEKIWYILLDPDLPTFSSKMSWQTNIGGCIPYPDPIRNTISLIAV